METKTQYTPEQIQEWQKTNNMEVFSLAQLCAILMKFEERQNEIARYVRLPDVYDISGKAIASGGSLFDKWSIFDKQNNK